ncbi:PilN domain-containing protein [Niveibacterium microcysteis]|uniref:PilN domain-containing protein n=1 Tax=Niveibacterium microcysteis TaxID=2811415 RepID=A0ABX7M6J8_9RHOO|nr:PilN domain-containing protein [Niveibacterium microcysteis]QSI76773.1 PilN domain-containing protein [Niveibacterium microcysteis]
MIRINLLPHREEARKLRRQQFYAFAVASIVLGGLIALLVHSFNESRIQAQQADNDFLKSEIAKLDKDIAEIQRLREQTQALLSRKQVIELLQSHRAETVHVFNELARLVPDGVYLGCAKPDGNCKALKQTGMKITLTGVTQSNARVSTLMRNLDASPIFERPQLIEIKAVETGKRRASEFTLDVFIEREKSDPDNVKSLPSAPEKKS